MTRRKAKTDTVEVIAADVAELGVSAANVARPRGLPAPYLSDLDDPDGSVHELDELEPDETLCGLVLEGRNLQGWSALPLALKSCESCLRLRRHRDELVEPSPQEIVDAVAKARAEG